MALPSKAKLTSFFYPYEAISDLQQTNCKLTPFKNENRYFAIYPHQKYILELFWSIHLTEKQPNNTALEYYCVPVVGKVAKDRMRCIVSGC